MRHPPVLLNSQKFLMAPQKSNLQEKSMKFIGKIAWLIAPGLVLGGISGKAWALPDQATAPGPASKAPTALHPLPPCCMETSVRSMRENRFPVSRSFSKIVRQALSSRRQAISRDPSSFPIFRRGTTSWFHQNMNVSC